LIQSSAFARAAKQFVKKHPQAGPVIRKSLDRLQADAFDPALRTHKLMGNLVGRWSCSAGYDLRIVFKFVQHGANEAIFLLSLGTHDEVY
jgi:mRNA interferase YafQ